MGDAVRHDIVTFIASNQQLRTDLAERVRAQGMHIDDYILNMSNKRRGLMTLHCLQQVYCMMSLYTY